MHSERNHTALRALASFLILVLAFAILLIFRNNQTNILDNNQFQLYMVLATVGAALLVGLLYFVNKPQAKTVKSVRKTAKKSAKRSKKK
jgi:hypothetical protein